MDYTDVLFLHPSAHPSRPMYLAMPMGMISVMNRIKDLYSVRAINVGLEMSLQSDYQIQDELKRIDFNIAAIDLHWHEHSFGSLELARLCKQINPECKVVLGGITASLFSEEIVSNHNCVDFIIKGDGEKPFFTLLEAIGREHSEEKITKVSGITYFDQCDITDNPVSWTTSNEDDEDYVDITKLKHWEEYLKSNINFYSAHQCWRSYWLCIGKGCIHNCSFCGGGGAVHKRSFARPTTFFRSTEKVFRDLRRLSEIGVHVANFSHDPQMEGEEYWRSLFHKVKQGNLDIGGYIELDGLPEEDFIKEFANSFTPELSTLVITPLCGNDEVRAKNGKKFKNVDLMRKINRLEDYSIPYVLYFAVGLPFDSEESFNETISLAEKALFNPHLKMIFNTPLTLDPGSPMFCEPENYGIFPHLKTFCDYYKRCKNRAEGKAYDSFGYHTDRLSNESMLHLMDKWNAFFEEKIPQILANSTSSRLNFL
ncbi:MAG: (Dimethylallyl)adenosine tRNA methylthiotransferase MiaB [Methanosaeta sp. PtaU1.Bin112]|nr:MAG: (Dimethylallyl)adenosine tRNA methylthiotransferase MiaB [Methanosaeta sp. PtaU1.Bin112]